MKPSDFLTILTIVVAVWTVIPKKEKSFILLFFSRVELWSILVGVAYVHFLMSFDWLLENWFSWLSIFTIEKGIPAETWAYIIALLLLIVPVLKVLFGYFSKYKKQALVTHYNSLLKQSEIDLLSGYVQKYHINDIQRYLVGLSNLPEKESIDIILRRRTEADQVYEKLVKPTRINFAASVYGHILQDEQYVKAAATKYPDLFATAIKGMQTKRAANQDFVKLYIECLFEAKNQSFIQELKIVNNASSSIKDIEQNYDLPILSGLLVNTEAAAENYVWYPVGEGAVKSLKFDDDQKAFLIKEYDHHLEPELWNYKIWIATVYFNYMVRETIYRDSGWHMWLFYFRHTIDHIIELIPEVNNYRPESEHPSFAHYIIYEQFDIMLGWIRLAKDQETDNQVIDTIRCLGWCIHSVCQACEQKLSKAFKKRQLDRCVDLYLDYAYYPDNIACSTAREWLTKLFLNPKGVDFGIPEITPEYLSLLTEVWDEYDRIPFTAHGNGYILDEFETNILQPLGINI